MKKQQKDNALFAGTALAVLAAFAPAFRRLLWILLKA
jgi:hypothetical protein